MHIWLEAADRSAGAASAEDRPRAVSRGGVAQARGWVSWRTVSAWAAGVLATVAGAVLIWCRGGTRADPAFADRLLRWWAGVWLRAAGARVSTSGMEHLREAAPCVVVSDHQSSLDPIVALRVLPVPMRVLAMRELFRIPVLGPVMRAIGMIEVDRSSPDFREIDTEAARALAAGHSLLAYPEGRISPDGTIGKFKDGAFVIAINSQVPVVPVTIYGTHRIWPPGHKAFRPGCVHVLAARPLPTSGLTHGDVASLREQTREVIRTAHRDLAAAMDNSYQKDERPVTPESLLENSRSLRAASRRRLARRSEGA